MDKARLALELRFAVEVRSGLGADWNSGYITARSTVIGRPSQPQVCDITDPYNEAAPPATLFDDESSPDDAAALVFVPKGKQRLSAAQLTFNRLKERIRRGWKKSCSRWSAISETLNGGSRSNWMTC